MNWPEEAKKHTQYTRGLIERAAAGDMVTIECAMYLYEMALIHGWKHAEEYYGRKALKLVDDTPKVECLPSLSRKRPDYEQINLGTPVLVNH